MREYCWPGIHEIYTYRYHATADFMIIMWENKYSKYFLFWFIFHCASAIHFYVVHISLSCLVCLQTEEDTDAQRQFQFAMNTMTSFRSRVRNFCLDSEHVANVVGKLRGEYLHASSGSQSLQALFQWTSFLLCLLFLVHLCFYLLTLNQ